MATKRLRDEDENQDLERQARKRVREKKEFYVHATTYILVNALLILINLLLSPGYFWAIWPLLGWGIGLASHGIQVYGVFGIGSREWEERKVREYILQRQHGLSADQVRQLLHEELRSSSSYAGAPRTELDRLKQRIEHLEAIVTSEDWDRIKAPALPGMQAEKDPLAEEETPEQRAARLAQRIR